MNSLLSDYERIIRPIEQQMMRAVWRITQDADDADDAFQEALTQIWQRWPRIRVHPKPPALILRICANAACDVVRRRARQSPHSRSFTPLDRGVSDVGALEILLTSERRQEVAAALARLPEQQATAVSMRFLLSCDYQEIAQALDCAEPTARVHVARGLNRLRELLAHLKPVSSSENPR